MMSKPLTSLSLAAIFTIFAVIYWLPALAVEIAFTAINLLAAAYFLWAWFRDRRKAKARP